MSIAMPQLSYTERKNLTRHAIRESISARKGGGYDLVSPVNVYDLCEKHGVTVRFTPINMEGMYDRSPKPRIHISALRPLVRRNLTCAHELGHHVFGHGSTIDEISEQAEIADHNNPIEFIANQFAYNLMMPALGIKRAFSSRGLSPSTADSLQLFRISSHFSVGYKTLLSHLRYGLNMLPQSQYELLSKSTPKTIRTEILGEDTATPLLAVDAHWRLPTIDLETSDYILFAAPLDSCPDNLEFVGQNEYGAVYRALEQGIANIKLPGQEGAAFVRIAGRRSIEGVDVGYVGLAQYRHMGDDDDE